MYKFTTDCPELQNEAEDIIRLFEPEYKRDNASYSDTVMHVSQNADGKIKNRIFINNEEKSVDIFAAQESDNKLIYKRKLLKSVKTALYRALASHSGASMPYGSLTGIRPTKLARKLINDGIPKDYISDYLIDNYFVRREKADLIAAVIDNQEGYYPTNTHETDLYINIPFCPSRCGYCSFISSDYQKSLALIPRYLEVLAYEIQSVLSIIKDKNYAIRSIYIGGGTPTVLTASQLDSLLKPLPAVPEFTVEAGRPETVSLDKIKVLTERGVTRVSVNPQTFNDSVLNDIGRKHTAKNVIDAYRLCRENSNFIINMDIIAGLNNDTYQSFCATVNKLAELKPDNITVHTLSQKRASKQTEEKISVQDSSAVRAMTEYAHERLKELEYLPYYMYRQKYMSGNLENTGYCIKGTQCKFNIDTMEENISVLACGANGISKIYYPQEDRLERAANVKNIVEYMNRVDEMLSRKKKLLFLEN